jgi:hypothetical protein
MKKSVKEKREKRGSGWVEVKKKSKVSKVKKG